MLMERVTWMRGICTEYAELSIAASFHGEHRARPTQRHKYGMRFYEFATNKPRKPKKPMTPEQSLIADRKRQVDQAKEALQRTKDQQKRRKELERRLRASHSLSLRNGAAS